MNTENAIYYLILGRQVGKEENGKYFLFRDGAWEPDRNNRILDRLIGYDPSEPSDSPYWCGCTSIMDEIEEISVEKAAELTGGNL